MNHYKELINKIAELMNQEKYEESYSLILEEMKMPYIPVDIEKQLNSFLDELKSKGFGVEEIARPSLDQIVDQILSEETKHHVKHGLIAMLGEYDLTSKEEIIKEIFENTNIELFLKRDLVELLNEKGINKDILIKFNGGEKVISPDLLKTIKLDDKDLLDIANLIGEDTLEYEVAREMLGWLQFNSYIIDKEVKGVALALSIMITKQTMNSSLLEKLMESTTDTDSLEDQIKSIQSILKS